MQMSWGLFCDATARVPLDGELPRNAMSPRVLIEDTNTIVVEEDLYNNE